MAVRRALLVVIVTGCGSGAPAFAPVIDVPPADSAAYPYGELDAVTLSVARAGAPTDLVQQTFARGETLELANVPFSSQLVVHMSGTIGVSEVGYGRTCAFDLAPATKRVPHIYFSRIVKWATSGVPVVPTRTGGQAYADASGSAVFVNGAGADTTVVDRFDASQDLFLSLPAAPPGQAAARASAMLQPFDDGRALIVGGKDAMGDAVLSYEVLDPLALQAATQRTLTPAPQLGLVEAATATLSDGSVFVVGGLGQTAPGAPFTLTGGAWSFDVTEGNAVVPAALAPLAIPRHGHTATRLGNDLGAPVLVVGGVGGAGTPIATAELYEPLRDAWASPAVFAPHMVIPRSGHSAVEMPDGSVLIIGGLDDTDQPVPLMELYSPHTETFTLTGNPLPLGAGLLDMTVTPLPDGRVLLAGGRRMLGGPALTTAYIARLDPVDGSVDVVATDSLSIPRAGHSAVRLCDGTILVVGGTDDPTAPAERYNPPSAARR